MSETLNIPSSSLSKEEKYVSLIPQIKALVEGENDFIANLSNIISALKFGMDFFWVGVYFVKDDSLVLGPFQGPVACTRIAYGKGVCGTCWKENKTIIVPDVEQFPGHIACSTDSKSEIVLPVVKDNKVVMVLDIDSAELNTFDEIDQRYLEEVTNLIETLFYS